MNDDNIVKFQRPKPKKQPRTITPAVRKAFIWLAATAAVLLVWAYYQYFAVPPVQ
ncbi:hypothetical protein OIU34_34520 [Pararhizobium sp. BT-229]|uniref:hypothetical protein n=1 Tax=Pararhizobium sp. BT-229 TaxID=2986923 RepID=UPI0021F69E4C|nr:hypothetical protein [Pararhizobium sp. BT-229]MCV9966956.1 hypothetical protein [Pararhizobium sp. BT-229]